MIPGYLQCLFSHVTLKQCKVLLYLVSGMNFGAFKVETDLHKMINDMSNHTSLLLIQMSCIAVTGVYFSFILEIIWVAHLTINILTKCQTFASCSFMSMKQCCFSIF